MKKRNVLSLVIAIIVVLASCVSGVYAASETETNAGNDAVKASEVDTEITEKQEDVTVISKNLVLYEDMVVTGNLLLTAGIVDLNGFKLTVKGDLRQTSGKLTINAGCLEIEGDYFIETAEGGSADSYLVMSNSSDYIKVGGDFVTNTSNIHTLTAGTLEVKGDFIQRGRSNSFNSKEDFKVILSGDKKQTVTFRSIASKINYLEISNESEEGVSFEGYLPITKLYKSIEINGNVNLVNSLDLNGFKLTVKGNLYQTDGTLNINSGTLEVEGDYIIGTIEGGTVDSILSMSNSRDYVKVHGDFVSNTSSFHSLTAGTLEVKGDFIQRGRSNSFNSKGDFKVLLSGDKKQAVTFGSIGSVINYLEISNESEEGVTFEGCFPIAKLYESIEINGNVYLGRNLDLNGYKLTVKGNLYHTDGTLIINSGTLEVQGDYIIGTLEGDTVDSVLSMTDRSDYVKVYGDFISNTSGFHNLKAGTLEVKGDFIHKGRYNGFNPSKDHKVLLSGSGIQTVSFTDDRYGFNTLVITKPIEEGYIFANEGKVWKNLEETDSDDEPYTPVDTTPILINGDIKLSEDTEYFKDLILLDGSLDLNGYTLVVNGDFKQYSGNVYINGGKLIIKRNYMIQDFAGGMAKASLEMRNTDDYVEVFGNFVMNSSVDHSTLLIAGTLEIKGDLVQIYDDSSSGGAKRSFNASRDHNVILSGEGKQEVVFGSPLESKINNLIIKNSSEEGIIFRSGLPVEKLNEDVCIKGDLLIIRNLDLNGYALKVQGNLRQIGGTLSINGGYLEVEGDYLIESPEGGMVNAILDMRNEKDRVKILGDFVMHSAKNHFGYLNAGIMEISGDFTQRNEDDASTSQSKRNFSASENHRVLLNGEGIQTVVFRYPGESSFNELEITKPLETGYVFRNDLPVWKKLIESGQSIIYGDLNEDGDVDSLDLTILKRYLLRKIDKLPCQNGHIAADLNGDGDVDSLDLTILKRYLLRKIDKFPVSE